MPNTEDTTNTTATLREIEEADRIREVIANTYAFVKSAEYTKSVSGYTFDHYINEAKHRIKAPSNESDFEFERYSRLDYLEIIEQEFNKTIAAAKKLVIKAESTE